MTKYTSRLLSDVARHKFLFILLVSIHH